MAPVENYSAENLQRGLNTSFANVLEESRILAGPQLRNEMSVRVEVELIDRDKSNLSENYSASAATFSGPLSDLFSATFSIVVAGSGGSPVCSLAPGGTSIAGDHSGIHPA